MPLQHSLLDLEPTILPLQGADIRYYPGFIEHHSEWYKTLCRVIKWEQNTIQIYGKPQLIPRLNAWYGDLDAVYGYSGMWLTCNPWIKPLEVLRQQVENHLQHTFNSVLANYYRNGQDSVAWHADDEPELGERPFIASLSFGAVRKFSVKPRNKSAKALHIDLEGGSLLVMAGDTQRHYLHQVPKQQHLQEGRINLTFRTITNPCYE